MVQDFLHPQYGRVGFWVLGFRDFGFRFSGVRGLGCRGLGFSVYGDYILLCGVVPSIRNRISLGSTSSKQLLQWSPMYGVPSVLSLNP